jgi:hypothetical protein
MQGAVAVATTALGASSLINNLNTLANTGVSPEKSATELQPEFIDARPYGEEVVLNETVEFAHGVRIDFLDISKVSFFKDVREKEDAAKQSTFSSLLPQLTMHKGELPNGYTRVRYTLHQNPVDRQIVDQSSNPILLISEIDFKNQNGKQHQVLRFQTNMNSAGDIATSDVQRNISTSDMQRIVQAGVIKELPTLAVKQGANPEISGKGPTEHRPFAGFPTIGNTDKTSFRFRSTGQVDLVRERVVG